jgi:hypothetical protein
MVALGKQGGNNGRMKEQNMRHEMIVLLRQLNHILQVANLKNATNFSTWCVKSVKKK